MEQLNVKMYQDGEDFVLIFKNCSADTKTILQSLLSAASVTKVADADALPVEHKEPVITAGKYVNMTPSEILELDGDKGFANLEYLLEKSRFTADETADVIEILDAYLKERVERITDPYSYVSDIDDSDVIDFYNYFKLEFNAVDKEMCRETAAALTFEDFLKESSMDLKRSAMAELICRFRNRYGL